MREICTSGSEGGARFNPSSLPLSHSCFGVRAKSRGYAPQHWRAFSLTDQRHYNRAASRFHITFQMKNLLRRAGHEFAFANRNCEGWCMMLASG
jgi:hypothetical protein